MNVGDLKECHECNDLQAKLLEQFTSIAEFELQLKLVEEKLLKLKMKKDKMVAEVEEMRMKMGRLDAKLVKE